MVLFLFRSLVLQVYRRTRFLHYRPLCTVYIENILRKRWLYVWVLFEKISCSSIDAAAAAAAARNRGRLPKNIVCMGRGVSWRVSPSK